MSDPATSASAGGVSSPVGGSESPKGVLKSSMGSGAASGAGGVRAPDFDAEKLHPWSAKGPPMPTGEGMKEQSLEGLKVESLTPLTPEIISRQATINIGTVGHVAHGKSTTVKALSGVKTVKFKDELAQNITIKLGYANAKIYRSSAPPYVYASGRSNSPDEYPMEDGTGRTMQLVRHISFVDCPGHDILMATMLNGAAVMDAAILLIAANEPCPQPQTQEHLAAVEIMQLDKIIVLQNKVDIVSRDQAKEQYQQIKAFLDGGVAENAPILPVSAQLGYNVDLVCEYLARKVPLPVRDFTNSPRMIVIRSFDVNRPGHKIEDMEGGVAGGSILRGVLKLGDEIEILPGLVRRDPATKQNVCSPIFSTVTDLKAETNRLQYAVPGGLIGVGTSIDPTLTRADRLVGHVLGHRGNLPMVYEEIQVQYHLLRRLLGVRAGEGTDQKIRKLERKESLMVNVGSKSTTGRVGKVRGDIATLTLTLPVCAEPGDKIALSRQVDKHWRLIGWGKITSGKTVEVRPLTSKAGGGAASGAGM